MSTLPPHYPPNCLIKDCELCAQYKERFDNPQPHQETLACGCLFENLNKGHFKCLSTGNACSEHTVGHEL